MVKIYSDQSVKQLEHHTVYMIIEGNLIPDLAQ